MTALGRLDHARPVGSEPRRRVAGRRLPNRSASTVAVAVASLADPGDDRAMRLEGGLRSVRGIWAALTESRAVSWVAVSPAWVWPSSS